MMLGLRGQYTLRTLLLAIMAIAVLLGYRANHVQRRARAVAVIDGAGGRCVPGPETNRLQRWLA